MLTQSTKQELQLTKLHLMVKATNIGLWDMGMVNGDPSDPNNEFNFSDEFRHLLGFENEVDFPNKFKSQVDCMHPDDREYVMDVFRAHVLDRTGNTPYDLEYRMIKKSGEIGYFRDVGETMRDEHGNALHTAGALIDVTEKWKDALQKEMQITKIHMMVQAMRLGLWDVDMLYEDNAEPVMSITFSQGFRHILGFTDEEDFPNELESFTSVVHPEDLGYALKALLDHINDKTGKSLFNVEYRATKKNGDIIYLHDTAETIRDKNGNPIHTSGAIRDITDIVSLIKDADFQRQEAIAANAAKSNFLSTMSHEIRTPMNAILGITEIQLQKDNLSDDIRDAYEKIYTSGDLLLSIINDILDLSKIEAGKLELQNTEYEIASLLSDTCQLNMMRIGSKQIEFELNIGENIPTFLVGDELRIKQILNNLLSNAFKYTHSGTVRLVVNAHSGKTPEEETLVFTVIDTGQGMNQEQVEKLFDEFTRFNTEANRSTEGTGLGMNITKNLVQLMNGKIDVFSEPGKGSAFTVTLPQGSCGAERMVKEAALNLQKFKTQSRTQMKRVQITREPMPYGKVLIVDDVETNIFVAKGLMTPYKLTIESATSGYTALENIKAGCMYDVIFMDHMMPLMDGIETTKRIRGMGYEGTIVALTANAVAGQDKVFLNSGFDDFISKPIDIRQLNKILNTFIRDKHPEEAALIRQQNAVQEKDEPTACAPEEIDPFLAALFVKDAGRAVGIIENLLEKGIENEENGLRSYTIHMHGLRGALANIERLALSAIAKDLEDLSRKVENIHLLERTTPEFLLELKELISELDAISAEEETEPEDDVDDDLVFLKSKLAKIREACDDYDDMAIEGHLEELRGKKWSRPTGKLLDEIAEQLLLSGFDEIKELTN